MRTFVELVERYINPELCPYPEYKGKPLYSIKYIENGEEHVGYSTYSLQVISMYLKKHFISPALEKQEQDRWIPVTERLPEDYEHVLVSGEKIVKQAQFIKGMFEMEDGEGYATINSDSIDEPHFYTFKAIAWRPLPEVYQEEE